jgi:trimethylamine--corrinoid protein Co-methyltransferase
MAALTQILKPGNPFLYAFGPSVMEMRSGHDLYYTMDKVLWKIAAVQLARSYNFPVSAECGGTMTFRYDTQNGMEGAMFMLAAVASGANVLSGFGSGYTAMAMSAEMMLIQTAWMDTARFLTDGMEVDDLHLGLENIKRAGPGGDFLTDDLTLRYMHGGQFFVSDLFDHSPCGQEGKGMLQRAHQRVEQLITSRASPVPHDIQENIRRFFHDLCANLETKR